MVFPSRKSIHVPILDPALTSSYAYPWLRPSEEVECRKGGKAGQGYAQENSEGVNREEGCPLISNNRCF